jgi:hypothetical protein
MDPSFELKDETLGHQPSYLTSQLDRQIFKVSEVAPGKLQPHSGK